MIFPVVSGATAIDFCARLISQLWRSCVFVVDDDPTIYTDYGQIACRTTSEILIYRDQAACDAWEELGYDDSLRGTMVYLICEMKRLTVITEHDPSQQIVALLEAITYGLRTTFPTPERWCL
jgi:hypothetical protein